MRNIFSIVTALVAVSITLTTAASRAAQVEPEAFIASCAKALNVNSKITYIDEAGTVSKRTIGEIALRQFNQYHVLVEKKAPYMKVSQLDVVLSDQSPFIHDFEAPRDYYPSATVMGVDWTEAKGLYVQSILNMTVVDKASGSSYRFSFQSGQVAVVPKATAPKSPVEVSYLAAPEAVCAPWFDASKNAGFYDMQTK